MKTFLVIILALLATLSSGCGDKHLISNTEYRNSIEKSFKERKQLAKFRQAELFSVFDKPLSIHQEEALKFMFAFMPLSDLADYDGDFFLANVDISLRARTEATWGKDIPEEIFLHYVLPCRVNNENLDSFRLVYYDEILNRVKGKGMKEAALEINHWCHEKVSYQPADIRTSAPISTILSARGRCGEESTFTVAALRTAGIPARQVYTPRWAHTDDNHAWVEIWFQGEWFYMGACEPEPVMDRGWFTEPARRAMMIHTKSFGAYLGNENYITRQNNFTLVNNLAKYALTKRIFVKVLDGTGAPVNNAQVEYQLYNYAEFYPVAVVPADENGISQLETGFGDLLIWAHNGNNFDYKKISVNDTDTLILKLSGKAEGNYSLDVDLDVPVVRPPLTIPASEMIEQNAGRIADENIIRQKYTDSWMNAEAARTLALGLKIDTARTIKIIERSMGNYKEIVSFISGTSDSLKQFALSMLEILPDKDLRDAKSNILTDHLKNCYRPSGLNSDVGFNTYLNYVLNPRIANENLVSWRSYFLKTIPAQLITEVRKDPLLIVKNLDENIIIRNDENYYKTPLTPRGVYE
ncbi:MAG: transglutaminase domain-containing protein, partial [Bacteroidetes bacterium]